MGLFASLFNLDGWILMSQDDPLQMVIGQFPIEATETVSTEYAQFKSLNRSAPIVQFLSGNSDTLSFQARLFARDLLFNDVQASLDQLKKWTKRDSKLQRPHILSFRSGDGHLSMDSCVITGLTPIKYEKPNMLGGIKDVTLTINLLAYKEFSLEDEGVNETRYHRAKFQDYYELLCWNEYRNANFGDVIRKRHPEKQAITPGDVIKLPSLEAIQKERLEQKSLILKTAYGRKSTPQKEARIRAFDRTNRSYVSYILVE